MKLSLRGGCYVECNYIALKTWHAKVKLSLLCYYTSCAISQFILNALEKLTLLSSMPLRRHNTNIFACKIFNQESAKLYVITIL